MNFLDDYERIHMRNTKKNGGVYIYPLQVIKKKIGGIRLSITFLS
jgi:hypothetical protein